MSINLMNDPKKIYFAVQGDEGYPIRNLDWQGNAEILSIGEFQDYSFKIPLEKISEDKTINGFWNDGAFVPDENGNVKLNIKSAYKKFSMTNEEIIEHAKKEYEFVRLAEGEVGVWNIEERDRDTRITLRWRINRDVYVVERNFDALFALMRDSGFYLLAEKIIIDGYDCHILRSRYD